MGSISRLLVANRGEIAIRIAATARRLGMATVGVYSEPDAIAAHLEAMDVAVALGGASPSESYLRGPALIDAALATGCDAVHPGYGFLAENAEFADAVSDAGLTWVGPTPDQIRLLGDKVAAKQAAVAAGVPTTEIVAAAPGSVPTDVVLPALVKAAAGGGGRGMRVVRHASELADAVEAAAREAAAAFGDGTVFIEPYIERGRHIEVQVLGDTHGNVVHLGERECSIQRRNQKVVEESPSAGITDEVRTALCDGALALARHVGYEGAGTVEFLVGDDGTITFLEVNTRLQVEHPVTEAVTGLDLVELQLAVAAGEPLPITQSEVSVRGHAIEVRLVAEDPAAGWLPSVGTVTAFDIGPGVRVDAGVRAGSEVSADYDSLLAKVISHAPVRTVAAAQLARALRTSLIAGVRTNAASAAAILGEPDYLAARTPTAYLDDHPEVLTATGADDDTEVALLVASVFAVEQRERQANTVTGFAPPGWRNLRTRGQRVHWTRDGADRHVEYVLTGDRAEVRVGPWPEPGDDGALGDDTRRPLGVRLLERGPERQVVEVDGHRHAVEVLVVADQVLARCPSGSATFDVPPRFVVPGRDAGGSGPVSPLPGKVLAVHVEDGQSVEAGQVLLVVEAMKMEHRITADAAAVVSEVRVAAGDRVDTGDLLVELAAVPDG